MLDILPERANRREGANSPNLEELFGGQIEMFLSKKELHSLSRQAKQVGKPVEQYAKELLELKVNLMLAYGVPRHLL